MADREPYTYDTMPKCPRHRPGESPVGCLPGPTEDGGCCKVIPVGRPCGFSVIHRNPHHWDIVTRYGRAFRIRGEPGDVLVSDEREDDSRPKPRDWIHFKSVSLALAYCGEQIMHEPDSAHDQV